MIDNNIIQSLGAGSGIDTKSLVGQLVEIERAAPQQRIDDKKELTEAQISDFGLISAALATLEDAAEVLTSDDGLFSKTASFTDSDALIPSELGADVATGTYNFEVTDVAQSQSLSSAAFSSDRDAVGEGTLTFRFGDWDAGLTAFTEDLDTTSVDIVIDSSNNSLRGLRDAINDADMGVQASIVNDGTDYRLLITAESGENKQLEIEVAESGGTPSNDDASGLSRFSFNDTDIPVDEFDTVHTQQMTQNQAGADAVVSINGLEVTRPSNTIDDVVEGLTVEILQASPGETITVTVSDDKAFAEQNIRDFVDAYNAFLEEIDTVFSTDEETGEKGSLANDSLAKSIISRIRSVIASSIPGLADSNYSALTNVGIRTELDGTISISESDFESAFENNFEDVQKLFAPYTSSDAADITINSFGGQTLPGSYDVDITTNPVQGYYTGGAFDVGVTFPFDTTGKVYTFDVSVNGVASNTITIPTEVTYNTEEDLAAAIQSVINSDSLLSADGAAVSVSFDTDHFVVTSTKYGTTSVVDFSNVSQDLEDDLGISDGSGTNGIDVAGTIGGSVGFGLGNVLLPALGDDAEGLTLIVGENATEATVNYSRGFGGELGSIISEFLESTGLINTREQALEARLETVADEQEALDRRIGIYEERLIQQYIAMEAILGGLNSSGGFLENLIDTLPFTANND